MIQKNKNQNKYYDMVLFNLDIKIMNAYDSCSSIYNLFFREPLFAHERKVAIEIDEKISKSAKP